MPATLLETVTVTPTRTEQRLGDIPASVNVLTARGNRGLARGRRRRRAAADADVQPLPPHQQPRRAADHAGRVAARASDRAARAGRSCCSTAFRSTIPSAAGCTGRVCRSISVDRIEITDDTTSSLYGNYAMGGVINIVTTRPTRRTIELKPQYGNRGSPKFDFFASDRWNKVGALVEGSFFNTDGFPIVAPSERGPIDNNANVDYRNVSAKVEYTPSDRVNAFFRAGYFTEDRNNGKVGEVNDTRWTTVNGGVRIRLPDDSDLQARVFVDVSRVAFQLPGRDQPGHDPQPRPPGDRSARADQRRRHDRGSGPRRSAASNVLSAGADWRWVDGDSQEDAYVAAVPHGHHSAGDAAATLSVKRVSGGTQQIVGRVRPGHLHADCRSWWSRSARASITGGTTTATTWRPRSSTGLPTVNNRPIHSRAKRHGRQPARRGDVSRDGSRERLGRGEFRVPRADAHRAVPPVFGRRGHDASQRSARARASGRRGSRGQRRAGAATSRPG